MPGSEQVKGYLVAEDCLISNVSALCRSPLIYKLAIHELIPRPDQYPPDWDSWPVQHELTGRLVKQAAVK